MPELHGAATERDHQGLSGGRRHGAGTAPGEDGGGERAPPSAPWETRLPAADTQVAHPGSSSRSGRGACATWQRGLSDGPRESLSALRIPGLRGAVPLGRTAPQCGREAQRGHPMPAAMSRAEARDGSALRSAPRPPGDVGPGHSAGARHPAGQHRAQPSTGRSRRGRRPASRAAPPPPCPSLSETLTAKCFCI